MLNEIVEKLYNSNGNICSSYIFKNLNQKEIKIMIKTPSKNKKLFKCINSDSCGYDLQLTDLGIRYFENGFKFDRELKETRIKKIIIGIGNTVIAKIILYFILKN